MEALEKLKVAQERIREQIRTVVIGQEDVVEQLLVSILAGGHCILEGSRDWQKRCWFRPWPKVFHWTLAASSLRLT